MDAPAAARRMWTLFEPVHVVTYFSAEAREAFEHAGLRGFWRGYFAGRAAPMGAVGAAPVVASFFVFAPAMVRRALPSVWSLTTPADVLRARETGAVAAIRQLLELPAGAAAPASVRDTADALAAAAGNLEPGGRALAAANIDLPVPEEPVARLWHAATLLREHRGDGHVAALVAADIDGAESLVLRAGVDLAIQAGEPGHVGPGWRRDQMQPIRGWTDDELAAAASRLGDRGFLDDRGAATAAGMELHRGIEAATDLTAARLWAALGSDATARLEEALRPIAIACASGMPFPNPIGVPAPVPTEPPLRSPRLRSPDPGGTVPR
jgi:Helix-turn-helix family